jgi:hypothetical protein
MNREKERRVVRRAFVVAGVVVLAAAVPLVVLAARGNLSGNLDLQKARWTTNAVSTSSTQWRNLPGLARLPACTLNEVSLTLSVTIRGAPAGFRAIMDGVPEAPMRPGAARFVPDGQESFSYTFVANTLPFEDDDSHTFGVQWRSPTGGQVRLDRGALNLLYQAGTHNCP